MRRRDDATPITDAKESLSRRQARRRRIYFALMGTCLVLILLAWNVVRLWSVPAAVVMSAIAAVIPPAAAILANWGEGG
ncbi:DUF3099 domain-containing protein [Nocardioides jensenii]|uniref:DUF3099 domain-containing protein n=1 Tax=Nocardioides jensenii TaxID=1843 RepID=UPI000834FB85|nr:DUF3099 domain-containing protein [Nocardioides jensenii]